MKYVFLIGLLLTTSAAHAQTDEMMADIKKECVNDWRGNYAMQEHCLLRQVKAFLAMHDIYKADRTKKESAILDACLTQWPRGTGHNWPMVQHYYNRQNAARKRLEN
ncbi:hypothetical protein [Hoeflea sp.]|uniref:hypothetical protein n=1 Tax=Hoeflea sp. TaxID=1940281 RepID=UPI002AFF9885|nr:hypothetical protein [Hoeflea sp.]